MNPRNCDSCERMDDLKNAYHTIDKHITVGNRLKANTTKNDIFGSLFDAKAGSGNCIYCTRALINAKKFMTFEPGLNHFRGK